MSQHEEIVAGNVYNKYQAANPIARHLMRGYFRKFDRLLLSITPQNILEVGCGEGYLASHIKELCPHASLEGTDLSQEIIAFARDHHPGISFKVADVLKLPYADNAFDLVVASEVLEHVPEYALALEEIKRVGQKYFIFSVPREPVWRALNMLRLKYLGDLGNTPGHVNHWGQQEFMKLIGERFDIKETAHPFPWTMLVCTKK